MMTYCGGCVFPFLLLFLLFLSLLPSPGADGFFIIFTPHQQPQQLPAQPSQQQQYLLLADRWQQQQQHAARYAPILPQRRSDTRTRRKKSSLCCCNMLLDDNLLLSSPTALLLSSASPTTITTSTALLPPVFQLLSSSSAAAPLVLGGIPAAFMAFFTYVGLKVKTPKSLVGALQHFAAGILLATVAIELLPEMVNAVGLQENLASGIGFFSGVAVLIALGILLPEGEDDDQEAQEEEKQLETQSQLLLNQSLRNRQKSFMEEAFGCNEEMECFLCSNEKRGETSATDTDAATRNELSSQQQDTTISSPSTIPSFPTALLTAIAIDAALDGLLIGIAIAAGPSTGPMLSASLSVEMSFLGLTLATAMYGRQDTLTAALIGPSALLLGSIAGGNLAGASSPVVLAGLLGFGTSALLFMVAEELLLEAHEDTDNHVWWVDAQLYTGFFASVMIDKFFVTV